MGYVCALCMVGALGLGEAKARGEAKAPGSSGLIHHKSVGQLGSVHKKNIAGLSFAMGVIHDAKSLAAFKDAAAPDLRDPRFGWVSWLNTVDWSKDSVVCVVRTAPTNLLKHHSWDWLGRRHGRLRLTFHAIEPHYGKYYPAVFYRVPKTLQSVSVQVELDGWQTLGQIEIAKSTDRARTKS